MPTKNKFKNKFYSYNSRKLPRGCAYCVKGEKLVLFVTGICPRKCCFCPVSDEKYQQDVIFANEQNVNNFDDVVMEAKSMNAKGAGITGGDPLARLDRTVSYIKKLKEKFGNILIINQALTKDMNNDSVCTLQYFIKVFDQWKYIC